MGPATDRQPPCFQSKNHTRESHASRDSRQVFDSRVERLTRERPENEAGFLSLALGAYREPLAMNRVVAGIGKHLALPVERLLRGTRADRACFRPYRIRTQGRPEG